MPREQDPFAGVEAVSDPEPGTLLRSRGIALFVGTLLLTPEGFQSGGLWTPWTAIRRVGTRGAYLKLTVDREQLVVRRPTTRVALLLNRGFVYVPTESFRADAGVVYGAFLALHERPERRHLLADPGGADGLQEVIRGVI